MADIIEAADRFTRHRDFDAAWSEQKKIPVTVQVFGEIYSLSANLPAGVVLEIMRLQTAKGDSLNEQDILHIAVKLFTPDLINTWVDQGLDIVQLSDIVAWVLQQYGVTPEAQAGAEKQGAATGKTKKLSRS